MLLHVGGDLLTAAGTLFACAVRLAWYLMGTYELLSCSYRRWTSATTGMETVPSFFVPTWLQRDHHVSTV